MANLFHAVVFLLSPVGGVQWVVKFPSVLDTDVVSST